MGGAATAKAQGKASFPTMTLRTWELNCGLGGGPRGGLKREVAWTESVLGLPWPRWGKPGEGRLGRRRAAIERLTATAG